MTDGATCLALMTDAYGGRGGIAQYNRDLIDALAAMPEVRRVEIVTRYAPDTPTGLPAATHQHAARTGRLDYAWTAWRAARRLAPTLVFCGHIHLAPLAAAIARRAGARLVLQTHGIEAWTRPSRLRRSAAEACDLILAVSRDTRARVLDWANLPPERVRVAPNTVGEDYAPGSADATRARLGLDGRFAILTVGRLAAGERYKGHDRVIRLLPGLAATGRDVVYLVAGEGDDRPRLEALARELGAQDQVRFLGQTPPNELPDLYRGADLFVLASTGEGFGIVLIEAMACGTPALGLAVAGAADALADGALGRAVSPQAFPDALAGAIVANVSDPGLPARVAARFGRAAFRLRVRHAIAPVLAARPAALRDAA